MSAPEEMTKYIKKAFIKETDIKKIIIIYHGHLVNVTKDYTRTWVDREGNPYKYEFRGSEYQGYHNPHEVVITK